tara:strand:- start:3585 stop:4715 length:1131 start_codon:yes stop_codon:yes gene_type:complete
MIIFKSKYENAWEISEMQILCTNKSDIWDYEIVGNYENNLEILKICLKTIFLNPDKMYKLDFGNIQIVPKDYNKDIHGLIYVNKTEVVKLCKYHEKIVSFYLYDMENISYIGILKNIELYKEAYPDIKCYVYVVKDNVTKNMIKTIKKKGGVIKTCVDIPEWYKKILNILPYENDNKLFLSRNSESRLLEREQKAIEKFLAQRYNLNIIRDNPNQHKVIPCGLWGSKSINDKLLRLKIMEWCLYYINEWDKKEKEFIEQQEIRNKLDNDAEEHEKINVIEEEFDLVLHVGNIEDYIFKEIYEKQKKNVYAITVIQDFEGIQFKDHLDIVRKDNEYIGEIFDENNKPLNIELRNDINKINTIDGWAALGEEKITINL